MGAVVLVSIKLDSFSCCVKLHPVPVGIKHSDGWIDKSFLPKVLKPQLGCNPLHRLKA